MWKNRISEDRLEKQGCPFKNSRVGKYEISINSCNYYICCDIFVRAIRAATLVFSKESKLHWKLNGK